MDEENSVSQKQKTSSGKILTVVVVVILLLGLGFWLLNKKSDNKNAKSQTSTAQNQSGSSSDKKTTFTREQVATHNTKSDCWMIISDKVYNVTDFVSRHPGGNEILRGCGIDATTLFTERMTADGQKVGTGTPHSTSAQNQLKDFLIGNLSD